MSWAWSSRGCSGGNPLPADCSGNLQFDFNAWIHSGVDPALQAGSDVHAQWWYRDVGDPFTSGLSDAIRFEVGS